MKNLSKIGAVWDASIIGKNDRSGDEKFSLKNARTHPILRKFHGHQVLTKARHYRDLWKVCAKMGDMWKSAWSQHLLRDVRIFLE